MAYSESTEYPAGIYRNVLTAARTVTLNPIRVAHITITWGAAVGQGAVTIRNGANVVIAVVAVNTTNAAQVTVKGFYSVGLKFDALFGARVTVIYFRA